MDSVTRRRWFVGIALGALMLLVGASGGLMYRDMQQMRLDQSLIAAIKRNDTSAVRLLLVRGASPNARDDGAQEVSGWRRLWNRFHGIRLEAAGALPALVVALNVCEEPDRGFLPVYKDTGQIVGALLDHGADPNTCSADGESVLMMTAEVYRSDDLRQLIAHGADVKVQGEEGETPLMCALRADDLVTVRLLLQKGVAVNACDKKGETALHWGIGSAKAETIGFLLERGADVNLADREGETPLHWAASAGADGTGLDGIRLLIAHGADINRIAADGETPLFRAAHFGNANGVKLLLAAHADARIRNRRGDTALSDARRRLRVWNGESEGGRGLYERQGIEEAVRVLERAEVRQ
ncbi:MAG: ankyrin repeat and box protein 2-like isoform [Chthonomonadales bacterium]|nr:ankyrin repeat and box protein 2-like isoform [Chthonomonadales bacterium]